MKRFVRKALAHAVARMPRGPLVDDLHYDIFQSRGLHIRPVHFYSPVPNTAEIDQKLWDTPSEMKGVDQNIEGQSALLREIQPFLAEYHKLPTDTPSPAQFSRTGGFGDEDGALLYSMIRKFKPRTIIEIGAGKSTLLSALALEANGDDSSTITAIDPYPQPFLKEDDRLTIVAKRVENIPLEQFHVLQENDILFIDSSHSVKIGGDVIREVLEIIPRLKSGVIIHIHDIFLPNHYPREWVMDRHICWTEQYIVQALLAYSSAFSILWGFNMMFAARPGELNAAFPRAQNFGNGSSLWLRRI